jgi:hypothetical protein
VFKQLAWIYSLVMVANHNLDSGPGPTVPAWHRDLITLQLAALETLVQVLRAELAVLSTRRQIPDDSRPADHPESAEGWYAHMLS